MKKAKKALITGITGQDGSYLAELLLEKGYDVHGIKRRASSFNTERIDHIYTDPHEKLGQTKGRFTLHYGDITDSTNVINLVKKIEPDEVYNLAAQSHVQVSFETPEYTAQSDALGTLRFLEAIKTLGLEKKTKFYQASTSEMFGNAPPPSNEKSPFYPRSPYGAAKLYAHWITVNYREAYDIFASSGILFNHESPRRGETFVTRKITRAATRIKLGLQDKLYLGNIDAKRDWGHARDFVEAMYLMLQHNKPDDFVIATGKHYTVRKFAELVFKELGITLLWEGTGKQEKGIDAKTGKIIIKIDPRYFRPTEVHSLLGDAKKARKDLGWKPKTNFQKLIKEMVAHDYHLAQKELYLKNNNFQ